MTFFKRAEFFPCGNEGGARRAKVGGGECCRAITQAPGRLYDSRSRSSVSEFGFQLDLFYVVIYLTVYALNSDLGLTSRTVNTAQVGENVLHNGRLRFGTVQRILLKCSSQEV